MRWRNWWRRDTRSAANGPRIRYDVSLRSCVAVVSCANAAMKLVYRLLSSMGWWTALAAQGKQRILGINALVDAAGTGLAAVCLPFFGIVVVHMTPGQFALALSA